MGAREWRMEGENVGEVEIWFSYTVCKLGMVLEGEVDEWSNVRE
jgi:hypothetical protein